MILFWKKTDKSGKKKPPKPAVPRTAQQSIPMQRMFEDGTCRVKPNYYTRTIQYQDINYQLAQQEDKTAIFEEWCSFLNFFDSSIKFELSFVNMATDSTEFEKSIRIPFQKDGFDDVRAEYSQMLRQQLAKGNNGLTKTKFITFGVEGESMAQVKPRLDHIQNDLLNNFHRLGVQAKPLNGAQRLKLMHDMFNILMVMSGFSSCGILFSGGTQVSGQTMYSAEDRDIRGAEQDYKKLEKELDKKIKRTPTDHPGYNEYQYHLDPIEHDPWQLTSFLTTLYDDYTRSEVQGKLKETFKKQYKLTTWVEVQIRYKIVWVISPAGIPVPTQVPYEYKIFHTKLVNKGLEVVIREELDNDQWKRYEIFQDTLGGRPYLFNGGLPPGGSDGSGTPGIDYQVPAEALTDSEFAAIYKEAQKYVGTPYVWGGSTPETGFDCSGYVCWVYNQNGYDVGRTTANGLWNKSQHISEAEAKPGDLVFFKGTYDTPGMSHTGIYLGNGMMVSAGDPIKYANIHSSYWEKHLAGFGRLSK